MFLNRPEAGKLLANALHHYFGKDVIVLALPRGGVPVAAEIAFALKAPLDLIFAHKIGHPLQEEYAIAAVSEGGAMVGHPEELEQVDKKWLEEEKEKTYKKMMLQRKLYLQERKKPDLKDRVVILVDDGVATGLTLLAAIFEVKQFAPAKLVIAVPVAPQNTADKIKEQVDELIALQVDQDGLFLGSVGAYYQEFPQVQDQEVIELLKQNKQINL
ncbi:MAG: phosphoribosyltransferase family protein [Chlamydiota bacterium]